MSKQFTNKTNFAGQEFEEKETEIKILVVFFQRHAFSQTSYFFSYIFCLFVTEFSGSFLTGL